jgi:hypothetical protein
MLFSLYLGSDKTYDKLLIFRPKTIEVNKTDPNGL